MRLLPLLLLAAFAPLPSREITGVYEITFERQTFRPCGLAETWWVGTAPASLQRPLGTRAVVRVRGTVGPAGRFGHLGRYPRQIHVSEVLAHAGECPRR